MISLPLASELEEYYVCLQEYHWRKEQYEDLMLDFLYRAIGYGYQLHRFEASIKAFHDWQFQKSLSRAIRRYD